MNGGPFGGQTVVTVRNEHLSYIITWSVSLHCHLTSMHVCARTYLIVL